jgi:photosystem II stability/assembly factor-like uncharacterized protein
LLEDVMKLWPFLLAGVLPLACQLLAQTPPVAVQLARLPLYFEPDQAGFVAHTAGGVLELSADSVRGPVALRLEGARRNARLEGVERLASQSHYLIGNDPTKWRTHVPNYARVRVRDVWPGIDIVYYGNRSALEFDFVVAAGADASRIQFVSEGGRLRDPVIYQDTASGRRIVSGRYTRRGSRVTFELAAYDHRRPLVIDPVIEYSTALGGGGADSGNAIAVDASGAAYIFGFTYSGNFPVTNSFQTKAAPGRHLFVAKLAPGGGALVYSTYLGGTIGVYAYNGIDNPGGIAVDASGSATVAGTTASYDFPIAGAAPFQKTFACCSDGFAARLSPDGSTLVYSTFISTSQGIQTGPRLALDGAGNAYLTGQAHSQNFPVVNPISSFPTPADGLYMVKLRPDGTTVYSTFLGGPNAQAAFPTGIAADDDGNAYVTGSVGSSQGFPLVNPIQSTPASPNSPFVAKLKADGSALIYSTFLGGSSGNDRATAIAADAAGNAYVTGTTNSADFPTANPLQARIGGGAIYKSSDGGVTSNRSDLNLPNGAISVAVDPMNSSTLYATISGQYGENWLYRSTDAGGSWVYLTNEIAFALDPSTSGTLYASSGAAIQKSTDAGTTWTKLYGGPGPSAPLGGSTVHALVVDPMNPSAIYAGYGGGDTLDGVYKSSDGGATWAPVFVGSMHGVRFLAVDPLTSTVYVLFGGGGYGPTPSGTFQRSTDGGQTWAPVPNVPPNLYPNGVVFDPADSATFYILAGLLYKTTDAGQSFTTSSYSGGGLAIDPKNSSTLYTATFTGLLKSIDWGQTWNPTAITGSVNAVAVDASSNVYAAESIPSDAFVAKLNPQGTALVYSTYLGGTGADAATAIAADSAGNAYVAGSTSSTDFPAKNALPASLSSGGNQFLTKLDPIGSSLVYSSPFSDPINALAADSTGAVYLTGSTNRTVFPTQNPIQTFTTGTFFQSTDGGNTWTGNPSGDAFTSSILHLALDPQSPSQIFAQTQSNIYHSTDGGATFSKLNLHPPPPVPTILSVAIAPLTSTTLYAGTGAGTDFGVYRSTDGGQTWSRIGALSMVNALAVSPQSSSIVFAATDGGLMESTDGGVTWNQSGTFYQVYTVIFDPQNPQTLYASAAMDGVFKSTDGGTTWTAINNGFPSSSVTGPAATVLTVDPFNHSVIYAAGHNGIFRSVNGGANWSAIDAGLNVRQGFWVSAFAIDPVTTSTLYAGLDSGGLFKSTDGGATWALTGLTLPTVSSIAVDPSNPARIIAGAYFNPSDAYIMKLGQ